MFSIALIGTGAFGKSFFGFLAASLSNTDCLLAYYFELSALLLELLLFRKDLLFMSLLLSMNFLLFEFGASPDTLPSVIANTPSYCFFS